MNTTVRIALALVLATMAANAQQKAAPPPSVPALRSAADLENLVAPIALYSDPLIAWPAGYGETGIMTFIVNQQGRVCQRDLGADTLKIAGKMKVFDPDKTWAVSPD